MVRFISAYACNAYHNWSSIPSHSEAIYCNPQLTTLWYCQLITRRSFERQFFIHKNNSFLIWLTVWCLDDLRYLHFCVSYSLLDQEIILRYFFTFFYSKLMCKFWCILNCKGSVVVMIVWYLDLQLPMQSILITTKVVSSNPVIVSNFYFIIYDPKHWNTKYLVFFTLCKRMFKQRLSTIPSISTKWTATSCLKSLNTKKKNMAYADRIRYELIKEILLVNGKLFKDWLSLLKWEDLYDVFLYLCIVTYLLRFVHTIILQMFYKFLYWFCTAPCLETSWYEKFFWLSSNIILADIRKHGQAWATPKPTMIKKYFEEQNIFIFDE